MAFEKDPNEIGVLWLKSSGRGDYMTGEIAGQAVVCFPVKSNNPKAPTWRVLKSQPRDAAQAAPRHERESPPPPSDDDLGF